MKKSLNHINNSGFKVPEGYFEGLEDQVIGKISEENLKAQIQDPGYAVPDNYFEGIEDMVMNSVKEPGAKVVSLFSRKRLYYISGAAAALVIFFSVLINRSEQGTAELDYELVENYILDQDLSSYEIASLLTENDFENADLKIMDEVISEESLEDYLLENIDLEEIIEQ